MDGLDSLPAWVQGAVFLGVLLATLFMSIIGWWREKFLPKWMQSRTVEAPPKDAVVMSAAIADSAAINNLATAINRMVDFQEQDREDQERRDRALRTCIQELLDGTDRNSHLLRQILHPFGFQRVAQPGEKAPPDPPLDERGRPVR